MQFGDLLIIDIDYRFIVCARGGGGCSRLRAAPPRAYSADERRRRRQSRTSAAGPRWRQASAWAHQRPSVSCLGFMVESVNSKGKIIKSRKIQKAHQQLQPLSPPPRSNMAANRDEKIVAFFSHLRLVFTNTNAELWMLLIKPIDAIFTRFVILYN